MSKWAVVRGLPVLGILALVYIIFAYLGPGLLEGAVFEITLPSGDAWRMTTGQLLVALGLVGLYLEILKATRTTHASVLDHMLSTFVFIACLVLFLLVPKLRTTTFFLIGFMALLDVIAGFTVTITAARRDFGVSPGAFEE